MQGFKSQASNKPTALGSLLQASTYGATIPAIYGLTQSPLLAIWAANMRQGGSGKKGKSGKKGVVAYVENIDFLLGHNPIRGVLQVVVNGTNFPLNFTSQSFSAAAGRQSLEVSDAHFYAVIAVTVEGGYSFPVNDYGSNGYAETLNGSFEIPLWNELEQGPDPTNPSCYRNWPYCYRWQPGYGATIEIDAEAFPGGTVKIYYAQLANTAAGMPIAGYQSPMAELRMVFEPELGSGTEYADAGNDPAGHPYSDQQIEYPHFAGAGSSMMDLGSSGALPQLQPEVAGKWGIYPTGDADFVDMIEDIFKSGLAQAAVGTDTPWTQMERGLSSYAMPGTIQKKYDQSTSAALPPMLYNLPNVAGNILVCVAQAGGALSISSSAGDVWTSQLSGVTGYQVWTATAVGGPNTVTISGASGAWQMHVLEVGGVGSLDSAGVFNPGTGSAGGLISKQGNGPVIGGAGAVVSMLFADFELSAPLPSDAVIQGIYPVFVGTGTVENAGFLSYQYGSALVLDDLGGFVDGSNFTAPVPPVSGSSGEFYAPSIGTSLSDLIGQAIGASIACTVDQGLMPIGTASFSAVGFAIYFTTSASPTGAPPIPPPFTVPAGQQVAWALPRDASAAAVQPWTNVLEVVDGIAVVYHANCALALAGASSGNSATVGSLTGGSFDTGAPGGIVVASAISGSTIASTVEPGFPGLLMAVPMYPTSDAPAGQQIAAWGSLTPPNFAGLSPDSYQLLSRIVRSPGTYTFPTLEPSPAQLLLLSFKSTQPAPYPRPLGDYIDFPSLDLVRAQCRANGLYGSLSMNSQSAASDWITSLCQAANCAEVPIGSKLYFFPYSEVSAAGNGAEYTAATAAGPVANLSTINGDFVGSSGTPDFQSGSRIRLPNVLQMQCLDRSAFYNQIVVQQPDAASIALYGVRKGDPVVNNAVQDPSIARALLAIQVRRNQYGGDTWKFTASAKWLLQTPMDLITLTDDLQDILNVPVRITEFNEQDDGSFEGAAEPFVYGMCAPTPLAAGSPTQNSTGVNASAGNVNLPIIFEPVPRLYANAPQAQLWVVVSSKAANYGGCVVLISTDGGSSYDPLGDPIIGSAITGEVTADWPADTSLDTANDLALDLTESDGILQSYAVSQEDNFAYPCYVSGSNLTIESNGTAVCDSGIDYESNGALIAESSMAFGYELMTYATAQLTGPNKFTLRATGSGNHLDRAVFGAPGSSGIDHSPGSRFAFLSPAGTGILKISMDEVWVGVELFFKVISFNSFGAAIQSLADVSATSYTPTGVPGGI